METPQHIDAIQFSENVSDYLLSRCTMRDWELYCVDCGTAIMYVFAEVLVHHVAEERDAVSGSQLHRAAIPEITLESASCFDLQAGAVLRVAMPYCPACEPEPHRCGCVHLPAETFPSRLQ